MNQQQALIQSKYFLYVGIAFTAILLISNTVAVKITQVGPFVFDAATWLFPISYIFDDVLTEVYGYAASRKIIWSAFMAQALMAVIYVAVQYMPSAPFWGDQASYNAILGMSPRIVAASMVAFFCGEFSNSYVLSRMKVWSSGKHLWQRTIGSTIVGEGIDSVLFFTLAFAGTMPGSALLTMIVSGYLFKTAYEVLAMPITYAIVNFLKKAEGIDTFDRGINYNPFSL